MQAGFSGWAPRSVRSFRAVRVLFGCHLVCAVCAVSYRTPPADHRQKRQTRAVGGVCRKFDHTIKVSPFPKFVNDEIELPRNFIKPRKHSALEVRTAVRVLFITTRTFVRIFPPENVRQGIQKRHARIIVL